MQLPELPASLVRLHCASCHSLEQLPQLAHTGITELDCSGCPLLEELPDMPAGLAKLQIDGLERVTRLPRLPESLKELNFNSTAISKLPDSLSSLTKLQCVLTPIRGLPALPSCRWLNVHGCKHLWAASYPRHETSEQLRHAHDICTFGWPRQPTIPCNQVLQLSRSAACNIHMYRSIRQLAVIALHCAAQKKWMLLNPDACMCS